MQLFPAGPSHPAHLLTTAEAPAFYPFQSAGGTGLPAVYIGDNLLGGGSHTWSPWLAYDAGLITSPNTMIIGEVGSGKSSLAKTLILRHHVFDYRAFIIDPKGEWAPVARALGSEPIAVTPGGSLRFNPLTPLLPVADRERLLKALGRAALGKALSPTERAAVVEAFREARAAAEPAGREPLIPDVARYLLNPTEAMAAALSMSRDELLRTVRDLGLALRELCAELEGMFDGPTSPDIRLDGPCVVLDLSAVYDSTALSVLMLCAMTWLRGQLRAAKLAHGDSRLWFIVDEAWRLLSDLASAEELRANAKLSRDSGWANTYLLHNLSALDAAGADGSREKKIAEGLLKDCGTKIVYQQDESELDALVRMMGLSQLQAEWVAKLPQAVAMWRVGELDLLVRHQRHPYEISLTDTDDAMRGNA